MTNDDSIAYTTPVGYSQKWKGIQGVSFGVTRIINPKVTLNKINNYI
jgi:hypothetical protein